MSNPTIKFAHKFKKLFCVYGWPTQRATLLNVSSSNFQYLPYKFVEYDTDNGKYKFPECGECQILIFRREEDGQLFTTVREVKTAEDIFKYSTDIGKVFDILYTDDEDS